MQKKRKKWQRSICLLLGALLLHAVLFSAVLLCPAENVWAAEKEQAEKEQTEKCRAEKEERMLDTALHAQAAVLLDMDSGRILYEKNGEAILPMASTTKIMTCIVALEAGCLEDTVTVSAYAAAQPKVHLGMVKGSRYRLKDLLYSLMLESHNDSAAAIAEYIGSMEENLPEVTKRTREESQRAVGIFCDKMTEKARKLGCRNTYFLTPNGLDASAVTEGGKEIRHSTTAADLAKIMDYCVTESKQREVFLEITRAPSHSFADLDGKRHYFCANHNAFLTMMEGALSGKTGFTSQAGYCYVGALERDGKRFALALLACGCPGHKGWKWEDCKRLFSYGLTNYEYREFSPKVVLTPVLVKNGVPEKKSLSEEVFVMPQKEKKEQTWRILTRADERVLARVKQEKILTAPVFFGTNAGEITYFLEEENGADFVLGKESLLIKEEIKAKDLSFFIQYVWKNFLL